MSVEAARRPAARVSWFVHDEPGTAPVRVWLVEPATPQAAARITVAMPGTLRNAEAYAHGWRAFGDTSVVLIPEFSRTDWPGARRYALGHVFAKDGARRPRERWAFSVIEAIHARARRRYRVEDERFDLWGHSAGAQFVHRMALFSLHAPVRSYLAAGAGWYTVPDPAIAWPYGVGDRVDAAERRAFTRLPLTLMRGERDTERDGHLRTDPEAERQGANRFERAATMLDAGRRADPSCAWRLVDVPRAGHEPSKMARAAQDLLRAQPR